MKNKLLIIGSNTIHTYNYIALIQDYFDEILLLTNKKNDKYNINTIEIDFRLGINIFFSAHRLKEIVKEFKPAIIHIHQANSYAFISLLGLKNIKIPKVLTAWGSDILINPKKNIIFKKILEFSLKHVDIVTSDSFYMANEIKIYNPKIDIKIANFGINLKEINLEQKENIIYSNRLHKSLYNIEKIIYAFDRFIVKNKDWRLIIGATGDDTENLKKIARDLCIEKNIDFIGWVDSDMNNAMYKKAKIYISIPSSDATSISLLEAISNNCICFVSNLPANFEHILDGVNGFIEPSLDDLCLEKYQHIDIELLRKVNNIRKKEYSKQYNREKFVDIYNNLIWAKRKNNNEHTIS